MKVLEQEVSDAPHEPPVPLWTARPETASRLRGWDQSALDWAKVRGYRDGENPARWRGHLDKLPPAKAKVQKVEHHAALPDAELPGFTAALRTGVGIRPGPCKFTILRLHAAVKCAAPDGARSTSVRKFGPSQRRAHEGRQRASCAAE